MKEEIENFLYEVAKSLKIIRLIKHIKFLQLKPWVLKAEKRIS